MQSLRCLLLILLSSFALATAHRVSYPPPLSTCILSGDPCPTGSTCTPTQTCGGLCLTRVTPPPQVPCTVGDNRPCPTGATCTPTMTCPATGVCGGACIATNPPPGDSTSLPSITCVVGGDSCPSGSFCTQTETCRGLCIATGAPTPSPSPTPLPCGGGHGTHCPRRYKCVKKDGKHCGRGHSCHGVCVPEY